MRPAKQLAYARKLLGRLLALKLVRILLALLAVIIITPIIFFILVKPEPAEKINYGVTFSSKYASDLGLDWQKAYLAILTELKPKYVRLVAYWDEAEPLPDVYNYTDIKWQLAEAQDRNVKVILTMGYKVPRFPECFAPEWWNTIEDADLRNQALYEYIKQTTTELKGYEAIVMWQVENEPFFPFGFCKKITKETLENEVKVVRSIDPRPILVQDSGEGGFWFPTYQTADYLGISMYRRIWYDFWKLLLGKSIYFQYPLAHWSYKVKSVVVGVPMERIYVTELQAEPWGPTINSKLTSEEKAKTMSKEQFLETINYAQKSGFANIYFWGVEWWLWEKDYNTNPYFWETGKAIIQN